MPSAPFHPEPACMRRAIERPWTIWPRWTADPSGSAWCGGKKSWPWPITRCSRDLDPTCHGEIKCHPSGAPQAGALRPVGLRNLLHHRTLPHVLCGDPLGPHRPAHLWHRIGRWRALGFNELTSAIGRCRHWAGARWPFIRAFWQTNAGSSSRSGPGYRGIRSTNTRAAFKKFPVIANSGLGPHRRDACATKLSEAD